MKEPTQISNDEDKMDTLSSWLDKTITGDVASGSVRFDVETMNNLIRLKEEAGEETEWLEALKKMCVKATDCLSELDKEQQRDLYKTFHSQSCYFNGCVKPEEHAKKELERT